MVLFFITGNKDKFAEAQRIIPELEQLNLDLPEIQEFDARRIIDAKLHEARKHHSGDLIVEDTSLYLDALGGLPGPLIKWFLQQIGNDGLAKLAAHNSRARAVTIVGHAKSDGTIEFFEGAVEGTIVVPRGNTRFGWDVIFVPDGQQKTFAEMSTEEKEQSSMRGRAFRKLAQSLRAAQ